MEVDSPQVWQLQSRPQGAVELDRSEGNSNASTYILSMPGQTSRCEVEEYERVNLVIRGGGKITRSSLYFGVWDTNSLMWEEELNDAAFFEVSVPVMWTHIESDKEEKRVFLKFYRKNSRGGIYNVSTSRRVITVTKRQEHEEQEEQESWWCTLL